jgi:hypothetical protein
MKKTWSKKSRDTVPLNCLEAICNGSCECLIVYSKYATSHAIVNINAKTHAKDSNHRLNMELDIQSLFGLHVDSCTHWLRPRNPTPTLHIWVHIRGRYWSAKIDDISL